MSPQFNSGDYLLLRHCKFPAKEDLVVYTHPHYGDIFKRVCHIDRQGFLLASDNPAGINSQEIGRCQYAHLKGKLLWHIKATS